MAELDKIIGDIENLKRKINPEIILLAKLYAELKEKMNDKFQEEFRTQKGDLRGLEDFYSLLMLVKRDTGFIRNVVSIFRRLSDISGYKVLEETIENSELSDIFQRN